MSDAVPTVCAWCEPDHKGPANHSICSGHLAERYATLPPDRVLMVDADQVVHELLLVHEDGLLEFGCGDMVAAGEVEPAPELEAGGVSHCRRCLERVAAKVHAPRHSGAPPRPSPVEEPEGRVSSALPPAAGALEVQR